ncbi:MAG: DUF3857 domain-containing protein [Lentisphaerae bacterium]|nr:DUF3857 domain-containing protein [Lentisphaerota bacterium]
MKDLLIIFFMLTALWLAGSPVGRTDFSTAVDTRIVKKAESVTKARFPDADNVLLFEKERYTYNKNGTYRATDELYAKILTEKGRAGLRQLTFHFNVHYNKFKVQEIAVIKPGGKIESVDVAANSRVVIDSSQMASNIYDPAQKCLVLSIPRIEVGDILYLRTEDEHFKARIPDFWSCYTLLQSTWPIMEASVEIDAPAALPLRSFALKDKVNDSVKFSRKQTKDRIVYKWHALNVPQVLREPGMPEIHTCVQRLLVSTARSWEDVSRWYWNLCLPRLKAVTPAMETQVKQLVKGKKSDLEKIKAIFQFVSQQIRYMGITPEKEAPGYEPHDVKLTFDQRYGVCRDKAALLVAMLQIAGFKAYPVLFMAGDPKDPEIPNGYFNHAVTAVELKKGNYILMDPTYESTSELFPAFQADMSYLVAHPEGETLRRSPIVPAEKNQARIRTKGKIDAVNTLHCETVVDLSGINDLYYRGALSRWSDEKKEQFFLGRLRKVMPGVRLEKLTIVPENIRNMGTPLKFKFSYTVPLDIKDSSRLLVMPELTSVFGVGEAVFQDLELLKRKYPLRFMSTCSTDEEYSVELPSTLKIAALPEKEKFNAGEKIVYSGETWLSGGTIKARRYLKMDTLEIKAAEYPALKKFLNRLKNARNVLPVAESDFSTAAAAASLNSFPGADSVIEKRQIELTVKDPFNWSVRDKSRRKILNYAGVKAHSEVKIPYLANWNEVELLSAQVISPDGKIKKVNPSEINHMDSPGNSAGPRYPAQKIMVVSLPGVVPGSVVELDIRLHKINRPVFSEKFLLASSSAPVINAEVIFDVPAEFYARYQFTGKKRVHFSEYTAAGRSVKKWQFRNIPRVKNESGQPPWTLFLPGMLFNAGSGNRIYAEKVNAALLEKCNASLKRAETLVRKEKWHTIKDVREKVIKVRDYVDKFIRKVDLPLSKQPLSALSSAGTTLDSGYGNAADRAILTGALLKALGVEFRFVGASDTGYAVSSARFFFHDSDPAGLTEDILVYVPALQWYLNDTSRFAAPGSVKREGAVGMELNSARITRIQSADHNTTGRNLKFFIDCKSDKEAQIQVTEELFGREYEAIKKEFSTAAQERIRRFFEARVSSLGHGGSLVEKGTYDFSGYPGILRYKVSNPEFLSNTGDFRILALPGYSLLCSTVALSPAIDRKTPFWRNSPRKLSISWNIVPPQGWEIHSFRPEKVEEGEYGSFVFTEYYSVVSGQIALRSKLILPVEMMGVSAVINLEEWIKRVSAPENKSVVFKKISVPRE